MRTKAIGAAALFGATLAFGLASGAAAAPLPREAEKLSPKTYDKLHRFVVPAKDEQVWEDIPWRETLWQAVKEGHERDRPILLFAMNGHPLGHT